MEGSDLTKKMPTLRWKEGFQDVFLYLDNLKLQPLFTSGTLSDLLGEFWWFRWLSDICGTSEISWEWADHLMAPTAVLTGNLFMPWWQSSQSQFRNNLSCPFVIGQPGELFWGFGILFKDTMPPEFQPLCMLCFHTHMEGQNLCVCHLCGSIVDKRNVKLQWRWLNPFEIKETRTSSSLINENEKAFAAGTPSSLLLFQCDGWWFCPFGDWHVN